jgi:hypothetical protein
MREDIIRDLQLIKQKAAVSAATKDGFLPANWGTKSHGRLCKHTRGMEFHINWKSNRKGRLWYGCTHITEIILLE